MLFPTIGFAVFFAVVFPVTWLLNAHNTWKKVFLVAASYYFYAAWRPEFTLLLLVSSVFNLDATKKPDPNLFVINYQRNTGAN